MLTRAVATKQKRVEPYRNDDIWAGSGRSALATKTTMTGPSA